MVRADSSTFGSRLICQSSASTRVSRLLSLRCRFVPSKFCFGLQRAWSNYLCIDFFFATPCPPFLQSKSTSIWVHHILRLSASAQKNAYAIKNIGTLWNFTKHLHPNFPEPYRVPAPEPCATSPAICTETLWNLTRSAPEPPRTSPGICTGTLRNLNRYLHRNPPEPSGTLQNLARNLVLKLHRIAPELIWAKDPIAKFCCWGKIEDDWLYGYCGRVRLGYDRGLIKNLE